VGREAARRLLAAFGSPQAVFAAGIDARSAVVSRALAQALAREPEDHAALLAATLAWLEGGEQRHILTLGDAGYPEPLLQTADPPLLLYLLGRADLLQAPSVAVVGSRTPTPQGGDNARRLGADLSARGFTVVSGLALGVDGAAHEGALGGPASTIAVIGTGIDIAYPSRHRALARRIAESGLIVSEFPIGTPPLPGNFPQRNRIIAGLSQGTLVVEAALRSGSLITARLAAEAGRDVFAVPGSIHSQQSRGCHELLRQGATLVETADDIVQALRLPDPPGAVASRPAVEDAPPVATHDALLEALGHDPASLDALQARTGLPAAALNARLLMLELDGQVARLPGGLYQRRQST
jgi:DNA processing protein